MKSNDFENLNNAINVSMSLTRPVKTTAETNAILARWPSLVEPQQVIRYAANYLHAIETEVFQGSSVLKPSAADSLDSD